MDYFYSSIVPYIASPLTITGVQYLYYKLLRSQSFAECNYDAMITLTSILLSKLGANLVIKNTTKFIGLETVGNLSSYITEPTLNYFIYNYFYKEKFEKKFQGVEYKKDAELMILPILQSGLSIFFDKTIVEWITGYNSNNLYQF